MDIKNKYLKYKNKYLELKYGGSRNPITLKSHIDDMATDSEVIVEKLKYLIKSSEADVLKIEEYYITNYPLYVQQDSIVCITLNDQSVRKNTDTLIYIIKKAAKEILLGIISEITDNYCVIQIGDYKFKISKNNKDDRIVFILYDKYKTVSFSDIHELRSKDTYQEFTKYNINSLLFKIRNFKKNITEKKLMQIKQEIQEQRTPEIEIQEQRTPEIQEHRTPEIQEQKQRTSEIQQYPRLFKYINTEISGTKLVIYRKSDVNIDTNTLKYNAIPIKCTIVDRPTDELSNNGIYVKITETNLQDYTIGSVINIDPNDFYFYIDQR